VEKYTSDLSLINFGNTFISSWNLQNLYFEHIYLRGDKLSDKLGDHPALIGMDTGT
jgi:hypothetical protein